MSSSLTSLVPVLDGTNYQQWASVMKSFLLSQRQWKVISKSAPVYKATTTTASASTSGGKKKQTEEDEGEAKELTVTTNNQEVVDNFEDLNDKAVGNICLRLHTICYQFNNVDSAQVLWSLLKDHYGQLGFTQLFLEFKGAMNTNIPQNADPRPAINKIRL